MNKFKASYAEYPPLFWRVLGLSFIDQLGWAIIFPFFSLFITERFNVGMTEVGTIFLIYSVTGIFGNMIGGALTDRFGRKAMIIVGLFFSALTNLGIGLITNFNWFLTVAFLAGFFSMIGQPAHQALLTDILGEDKRTEGFGMFRIVANLTVVIGPALGTLLYPKYFIFLFIGDAIISTLSAFFVMFFIPETKPESTEEEHEHNSLAKTFADYRVVFKDARYMLFLLFGILITFGYQNSTTVLPVFMRDDHGFDPKFFGYMMSMNAFMVVVLQMFISKQVKKFSASLVMAVGSLLYAVSYLAFGLAKTIPMFFVVMAVLTIGEMVLSPTQQKAIADFAPEHMRGRYMAISTFIWVIPSSVSTLIAGFIMDNWNSNYVWYLSFLLGAISIFGYLGLHQKEQKMLIPKPQESVAEIVD